MSDSAPKLAFHDFPSENDRFEFGNDFEAKPQIAVTPFGAPMGLQ